MELKKLMEHISIIPDYRQTWKVEHKLSDILLLTICAVISGAEGWEDIEDFGETHLDFLKRRLGRYRGFWGNTSRFFEAIW
ncbi:transposase family protein [Escherichia coli]|uniref:transposase family protein n=1 Tax=Escherichia coli TaxID=562 RepID=UPI003860096C